MLVVEALVLDGDRGLLEKHREFGARRDDPIDGAVQLSDQATAVIEDHGRLGGHAPLQVGERGRPFGEVDEQATEGRHGHADQDGDKQSAEHDPAQPVPPGADLALARRASQVLASSHERFVARALVEVAGMRASLRLGRIALGGHGRHDWMCRGARGCWLV